MAVEVAELIAHFKADTTKYIRDVEKAGVATTKTGAQAEAGSMKFKKIQTASKLAAVAGIAVLAIGMEHATKAAMAGQASTARLEGAYKTAGLSAGTYAKANEKVEAASRRLGFSNLDVRESLGSLIVATGSQKKAVSELSIAEDIARFKHVDLTAASKMLTMASAGSQRAIKQLGLTVSATTTEEDKIKNSIKDHTTASYAYQLAQAKQIDKEKTVAAVISMTKAKLEGQASAYASTAAGGMAQFHAQTEQIEEVIGNMLIPVMTKLSGVVAAASGWLAQHAGVAKLLVAGLAALVVVLGVVAVASKIYAAGQAIVSAATGVWTAAQWLLNASVYGFPAVWIVAAIALVIVAVVLIVKHFDLFKAGAEAAWGGIKTATSAFVDFFTSTVPQAFERVIKAITGGLGDAVNWVKQHWPEIATLISGPFAPIVALATGAFGIREKITDGLIAAKDWISNHWHAAVDLIKSPFEDMLGAAEGAFGLKGALSGAWGDIKSGIKTAFSTIGDIAKNALVAPINAIIKALDDIHIGIHKGAVKIFGQTIFPGIDWDWSPFNIPMLAAGGIVNKPTLALIGEKGPEAVVPLSRRGGAGFGGGDTYNIEFPNYVGSKAEIAATVRDTLLIAKRRRVSLGLS